MNKDSYKIIVRKVVDKVTGAIQTRKIPQTQEKIDHYLLASKPKIIKLLQVMFVRIHAYFSRLRPNLLDFMNDVLTCRHISTKSRRANLNATLVFLKTKLPQ